MEERGLGFHFLAQSGPWGALKCWPRDPTPHSDLVEQPWSQGEDIILCLREGEGEGFKETWSGKGKKKHFQEEKL